MYSSKSSLSSGSPAFPDESSLRRIRVLSRSSASTFFDGLEDGWRKWMSSFGWTTKLSSSSTVGVFGLGYEGGRKEGRKKGGVRIALGWSAGRKGG